jgi:hypothetical protein
VKIDFLLKIGFYFLKLEQKGLIEILGQNPLAYITPFWSKTEIALSASDATLLVQDLEACHYSFSEADLIISATIIYFIMYWLDALISLISSV